MHLIINRKCHYYLYVLQYENKYEWATKALNNCLHIISGITESMTPYLNLKMLSKLSLLFIFSEIYLIITVKSSSQKFYESLTPALGLEKNASIQKITKYYEKLYLRLHSKDYGFAKFGESCEVSTVDEIEDHLDMGYGIIRGKN